jgi:predicted N-formylglutamate amidohydrolase
VRIKRYARTSMPAPDPQALLSDLDPPVFRVERPDGASPFVLTCDHGGRVLPRALGSLGVSDAELRRHIAWDIGVAEVGRKLSERLDAFQIEQTYSRLVIDVNRRPGSPQSIVTRSERTLIPGNEGLSTADAERRARAIFHPYHDRIRAELDARKLAGRPAVVVALHSFTPSFMDRARQWHAGVLYNRDPRLGHVVLELLRREPDLEVGDNEPYAVSDETDYGVVVHGEQRGLMHVELEIRQDLIDHEAGQEAWAERLARVLSAAYARLFGAAADAPS